MHQHQAKPTSRPMLPVLLPMSCPTVLCSFPSLSPSQLLPCPARAAGVQQSGPGRHRCLEAETIRAQTWQYAGHNMTWWMKWRMGSAARTRHTCVTCRPCQPEHTNSMTQDRQQLTSSSIAATSTTQRTLYCLKGMPAAAALSNMSADTVFICFACYECTTPAASRSTAGRLLDGL